MEILSSTKKGKLWFLAESRISRIILPNKFESKKYFKKIPLICYCISISINCNYINKTKTITNLIFNNHRSKHNPNINDNSSVWNELKCDLEDSQTWTFRRKQDHFYHIAVEVNQNLNASFKTNLFILSMIPGALSLRDTHLRHFSETKQLVCFIFLHRQN